MSIEKNQNWIKAVNVRLSAKKMLNGGIALHDAPAGHFWTTPPSDYVEIKTRRTSERNSKTPLFEMVVRGWEEGARHNETSFFGDIESALSAHFAAVQKFKQSSNG
tara:strand:- start:8067 stop:8384 length:318 start_codon:yes stop_codon:yes gene_type:complete